MVLKQTRALKLLLRHEININEQDRYGITLLMMVSLYHNDDVLTMPKILLIHGANRYIKDKNNTPIHAMLMYKHGKVCSLLKLSRTYNPEL
jgi:ankyrin repeat protein